jgi:hypothetical protein
MLEPVAQPVASIEWLLQPMVQTWQPMWHK